MKKKFNITGTCYPDIHYMMDSKAKLASVMKMVEAGEYFTINRPRQYGKTTTLFSIYDILTEKEEYLPIKMNFQGIDEQWHDSDQAFATMFVRQLADALEFQAADLFAFVEQEMREVEEMDKLAKLITRLVHKTKQKLVLLIDEVDASSNQDPFLSFLGMLRKKYLDRMSPQNYTFHSVILVGVHDVKNLKSKLRNEDRSKYNSPWNIATDFTVDMSFHPHEIAPMLVSYAEAEGVQIDVPAFAKKLYYHTSGYPFLVSKLCKTIAEDILPHKSEQVWTMKDLEAAVGLLLKENNTNFDSLIKNLENNQGLYDLTFEIIINAASVPFNPHEPTISLGRLYGVFKENGMVKIHNRIYEQILYGYMSAKAFNQYLLKRQDDIFSFSPQENHLDLEAVLLKFQQFMQEEYSRKDGEFLERNGRLVFLAYLNPILNGKGHTFKEVEVSEERRLDVVVTYLQHKYVIELKRWYGEKAHQRGLAQLSDYLDRQHLDRGYLLCFEGKKEKSWRQERIQHGEKEIFAVWV